MKRLDWAATHLDLEGDNVETLRAILAAVWQDGAEALVIATLPGAEELVNPYEVQS